VLQAYKVLAIDLASYIGPSAVPEPAGWGMFLAGLGFLRMVLKETPSADRIARVSDRWF
jgi:hypothetical protein